MKDLINQNVDVLGLNSISLAISLSGVEQIMQIILLSLSIVYTLDRYITWKNGKKNNK